MYRAIEEHGQVIDLLFSCRREIAAARSFFAKAVLAYGESDEVITDRAAALAHVIVDLLPGTVHNTDRYANDRVECDLGRLKARYDRCAASRPTAPPASSSAATPSSKTSCGHYELGADAVSGQLGIAAAFNELASTT